MKIGIPKEIKNNENRVSCTPAGVFALCKAGHEVYVETSLNKNGIFLHNILIIKYLSKFDLKSFYLARTIN